jgi:phage-related protein
MGQLMAADWRTLKLEVLAETKQFVKGMDSANKETESFGTKLVDFGKKAALALAAAGVAAVAFAAKAIKAGEGAATANARIAQINESMGLFGDSTDEVTKRLVSYAEATARATGIDTNSIKITQAKLLTFKELAASAGEVGGEFDRATQAAINLAAAGFGSAETNAVQLGKALQDPIKGLTALSRSGVTFTEVEKERIKALVESNKVSEAQILILEAIETQVGGTALATANASDRIKVGFTQVQERIGLALLPAFEKLTSFLLDRLFPAFEEKVLPIVKAITEFIETRLVPILQKYLVPILDQVRDAFTNVSSAVKDNEGPLGALVTMFRTIFDFAQKYLVPILKNQLASAIAGIGIAFQVVLKIVGPIIEVIAKAITGLLKLIDGALQRINGLIKAYNSIPFLPNIPTIPSSSRPSNSNTVPSSSLPFGGATLGGSGSSGGGGNGGGGAVAAVVAAAAASAAASAVTSASVRGLVPSGNAIPLGFDVAAARRGEERGNIIVNVNAPSAIDEEGFTRAVVLALNQTQARTGGGGSQLVL